MGLRALLLEWGREVRTAHDVDSALIQLEDWSLPPDLILSDLHLGPELSGLDVLDAVSHRYRCDPAHPSFARLLVTGETRPGSRLHTGIQTHPCAVQTCSTATPARSNAGRGLGGQSAPQRGQPVTAAFAYDALQYPALIFPADAPIAIGCNWPPAWTGQRVAHPMPITGSRLR